MNKEGEWEQAKNQFEKIIENFPNYLPVYYTFSEKLIEKEIELEKAEKIIENGILIAEKQQNKHQTK